MRCAGAAAVRCGDKMDAGAFCGMIRFPRIEILLFKAPPGGSTPDGAFLPGPRCLDCLGKSMEFP